MPDTKLSALARATTLDFIYGIKGGVSAKLTWPAVLNVRDFGAKGDGTTDDTSAIQACFDAAFGPHSSPNGQTNSTANIPVFFPSGNYKITKPLQVNRVWSGHIYGTGHESCTITYAGSATPTWCTFTGSGSGTTLTVTGMAPGDVGHCLPVGAIISGTGVPAGTRIVPTGSANGGSPPGQNGTYTTSGPTTASGTITATYVAPIFSLNGWNFSRIEGIGFFSFADTTNHFTMCINIWADGNPGTSSHGNLYINLQTNLSSQGIWVTNMVGGSAVSENQFLNCVLQTHEAYGMRVIGANTLNQTVIGGGCSQCGTGYSVASGTISLFAGCALDSSTNYDIDIQYASTTLIQSVRTESLKFIQLGGGPRVTVVDCEQATEPSTSFLNFSGSGRAIIQACHAQDTLFTGVGGNGTIWMRACEFTAIKSYDTLFAGYGGNIAELTNDPGYSIHVSGLPTPGSSGKFQGLRMCVTDSTVALSTSSLNQIVAGGGTNVVPVYCDGGNWRIG